MKRRKPTRRRKRLKEENMKKAAKASGAMKSEEILKMKENILIEERWLCIVHSSSWRRASISALLKPSLWYIREEEKPLSNLLTCAFIEIICREKSGRRGYLLCSQTSTYRQREEKRRICVVLSELQCQKNTQKKIEGERKRSGRTMAYTCTERNENTLWKRRENLLKHGLISWKRLAYGVWKKMKNIIVGEKKKKNVTRADGVTAATISMAWAAWNERMEPSLIFRSSMRLREEWRGIYYISTEEEEEKIMQKINEEKLSANRRRTHRRQRLSLASCDTLLRRGLRAARYARASMKASRSAALPPRRAAYHLWKRWLHPSVRRRTIKSSKKAQWRRENHWLWLREKPTIYCHVSLVVHVVSREEREKVTRNLKKKNAIERKSEEIFEERIRIIG